MLILNQADVVEALSMADTVEAMKCAFTALGNGLVEMPIRTHIPVAEVGAEWLVMPSYVGGENKALASKMVGVFPQNSERGLEPILGLVSVVDPETGEPLAILEGASITGLRTAAVSAVATDWMANPESSVVAVIGSGVQARTHIEAMCCVRPIQKVRVYSRTRAKVEALLEDVASQAWEPAELEIADSADAAVKGADIVCACTNSSEPVFSDESVLAGTHINAVGLHSPNKREIPGETVARSLVVVDQRKVALHAGDLRIPVSRGLIAESHVIAELGEIAANRQLPIRTSSDQITFFKSVGLAMEDAVAAQVCIANARKLGLGQKVTW